MAITVKITSAVAKEAGVFRATGIATDPDGKELGKANVFVRDGDKGPELVLSESGKTTINGHVVTEYRSYDGPTAESTPELAKDVELTFSNLLFAI